MHEYFILIGKEIKISPCSIKLAASLETLIWHRRRFGHPRNTEIPSAVKLRTKLRKT